MPPMLSSLRFSRTIPLNLEPASQPLSGHATESLTLPLQQVKALLPGCVENLLSVYDPERALFPYITRMENGTFVNDYRLPGSLRYTINTLLGLNRAARAGDLGVTESQVGEMVAVFTRLNQTALDNVADLGLFVLLLSEVGWSEAETTARAAVERLASTLSSKNPRELTMQELAWVIWGAAGAFRRGISEAEGVGRSITELVKTEFVDPRSGLPRHSCSRYRQGVVSFGALVYFLRAMHEAADAFGDEDAAELFENGVRRTLSLQGPQGEWPWMIDVRTGQPADVYPIFSVHQDSMAHLFLLPAIDGGQTDIDPAIASSLSWGFGKNELEICFYLEDPFFAYRSIERAERMPRLRRYGRFLAYLVTHRPSSFGEGRGLRLNAECRSYHLGWILFVWSERLAPWPAPVSAAP